MSLELFLEVPLDVLFEVDLELFLDLAFLLGWDLVHAMYAEKVR